MRLKFPTAVTALCLAAVCVLRGDEGSDEGPGYACGLNAAYIFLNRTGHHVPYAELAHEFEIQNPPDSMLAIKHVLEKHGCVTVGVKTDADFFLDSNRPAIVHLQLTGYSRRPEDHFTCVVGASRQMGVEVLDPVFNVRTAAYITWLTFTQSYQGTALVLKGT